MSIGIREADLKADRKAIIDIVFRHLTPLSNEARFNWLYKLNPHGEGRAWLAVEEKTETVVGMLGAFARQLCTRTGKEKAWVLGDFCMDDSYRTLGPAVMLQRACLKEIDSGIVDFCYDFPSPSMMAVYKRLRIEASAQVVRLAKPLRINRAMRRIVKGSLLTKAIGAVGNVLLELKEKNPKCDRKLEISLQVGRCEQEFSKLAEDISGKHAVSTLRSAEYLNWRYLDNPIHRYELLTARRDGALLGCAVFLHQGEDSIMVDLFGHEKEFMLSALISHGVAIMKARGVQTVSVSMVEAHPWRELLERHGFKARETSPMVAYFPPGIVSGSGKTKVSNWPFMHGDRDI